jgi:hypothetical protein
MLACGHGQRHTDAAVEAGLDRDGGTDQLTDELIGAVVEAVRPDRPNGHGVAWEMLCHNHDRIAKWVGEVWSLHQNRRDSILASRWVSGTASRVCASA